MRKIPVTRNFDKTDLIGQLALRDGVEIPPGFTFGLAYHILEGTVDNPTKIHIVEVSLIPEEVKSKLNELVERSD